MRLNVLTAVSRPENLAILAEGLSEAMENAPSVRLVWHWRYDLARQHVGGQALKNAMLDDVHSGWVWVLDDDTLVHPEVLSVVSAILESDVSLSAIIVSQQRSDGRVLAADPANVVPGSIDIGQAFLRRNLIGDQRIPLDYNGDGMFLQAVLAGANVMYHPAALSLHNALTGVEVSA